MDSYFVIINIDNLPDDNITKDYLIDEDAIIISHIDP